MPVAASWAGVFVGAIVDVTIFSWGVKIDAVSRRNGEFALLKIKTSLLLLRLKCYSGTNGAGGFCVQYVVERVPTLFYGLPLGFLSKLYVILPLIRVHLHKL